MRGDVGRVGGGAGANEKPLEHVRAENRHRALVLGHDGFHACFVFGAPVGNEEALDAGGGKDMGAGGAE